LDIKELRDELLLRIENKIGNLDLPPEPTSLYEPYKYALSVGGKRVRPLITLLACGMNNGTIDDAIPAALAIEILHNFTLVHDDIMDSAETRRGKPSVFNKWNEHVAMLSGDLMFADAYRFLDYYGKSEDYSKSEYYSINASFNTAIITVCEGQAYDMEFVYRSNVSLAEYIKMISGKTAALLAASLKMGGIAAKASPNKQQILFNLGMEMGTAFQIQDDLLDVIADPKKFGKKLGGDIIEGKKTYLTILALERANEQQKKIITRILEQSQAEQTEVDEILNIMYSLQVISDVKEIVNKHYTKCYSYLKKFDNTEYRHELENLLIFLQNRDH
jgi:geranylgeranyl diphosphate synthase type II